MSSSQTITSSESPSQPVAESMDPTPTLHELALTEAIEAAEEDDEEDTAEEVKEEKESRLAVDISETKSIEVLDISKLNQWDYPVFELADVKPDTILTMVSRHCICFFITKLFCIASITV